MQTEGNCVQCSRLAVVFVGTKTPLLHHTMVNRTGHFDHNPNGACSQPWLSVLVCWAPCITLFDRCSSLPSVARIYPTSSLFRHWNPHFGFCSAIHKLAVAVAVCFLVVRDKFCPSWRHWSQSSIHRASLPARSLYFVFVTVFSMNTSRYSHVRTAHPHGCFCIFAMQCKTCVTLGWVKHVCQRCVWCTRGLFLFFAGKKRKKNTSIPVSASS